MNAWTDGWMNAQMNEWRKQRINVCACLADAASSVPEKVKPVVPLARSSSINDVTQQVIHRHIQNIWRS